VRIPLNSVIGFSEILLENATEQGLVDLIVDLKKIHSAAELFLSRVNEIVDFAKIDAGYDKLCPLVIENPGDGRCLPIEDLIHVSLPAVGIDFLVDTLVPIHKAHCHQRYP
jgi:signal transduction histidine kinase